MIDLTIHVVTGAAGFIGSGIVKRTLQQAPDVTVVGIDRLSDYYSPKIKRRNLEMLQHSRFQFIEADILSYRDLPELIGSASVIYHQAGQPGVRKSWGEEFAGYTNDNVLATQRLLECAKASDLSAFVYASSSSVYGDLSKFPARETDLLSPLSPYGVTKLAAEHLCTLYGVNFGVPTVSLRYFTVYGPGQRPDMAFTRFLTAARDEEHITIFGSGEQLREFTYIDDIVTANLSASSASLSPGVVINLSGGSSVSVNESLAVIEEVTDRTLRVERLPPVAGDVYRTGGSTDRARDLLSWQPMVDLRTGLQRQWAWVLEDAKK